MAYLFRSKGKDGKPRGRWRFQYTDWRGRRRTGSGNSSKSETEKLAAHVQAEQDAIRNGWKPAPSESDTPRPFKQVVEEHMAWGRAQGGKGGRPWAALHGEVKQGRLDWWLSIFGEKTPISEITLPAVEAALRELAHTGRPDPEIKRGRTKPLTGKTLQGYANDLHSCLRWAKRRNYLATDPLEGMTAFDTTPAPDSRRRALTADEIDRILRASAPAERLVYQTALCTGYRMSELRALRVADLDVERSTLPLAAEHTKARKGARQPIPAGLARALAEAAAGKAPQEPLLDMAAKPLPVLYRTMKRAGVSRRNLLGKVDFHALRVAYVSLVIEAGATVREAQSLARHATPGLTMNVYARDRFDRLQDLAEAVGKTALTGAESTLFAYKKAAGAEAFDGEPDKRRGRGQRTLALRAGGGTNQA